MSGLCGIVDFSGAPVPAGALEAMLGAAAYRGPDGTRTWHGDGAELGYLALNTTPESLFDAQPLRDPDRDVVLVADARIDNRRDLLRGLGLDDRDPAAPVTDAALLLAASRRWDTDCAAELIGDFAFAIWDGPGRRLFAARDPMGMRPFYYRLENDRISFASEVKQLLAVPGARAELFEPAVGAYLIGAFGSPEWTFYAGITQLAPGHALEVTASGIRTWRFWDIDPGHRIRYRDDEEYAEHFRDLFKEAVRARLRRVRPVGIMLSGGVDSSSVAATAGWLLANDPGVSVPELRAYCYSFDELTECDERHVSRGLTEHYGIPVTDVPSDDAWPLRDFPEYGPDRDEPFVFGHYVRQNRAFALARAEGTAVMLSGDRGDLVAGLSIFDLPALFWRAHWVRLMRELRTLARVRRTSLRRQIRIELLRPARLSLLPPGSRRARLPGLRVLAHSGEVDLPSWIHPEFARVIELSDLRQRDGTHAASVRGFANRERYGAIFMPMHMRSMIASQRMHAGFGQAFADPWSDRRLAEFTVAVPQRVLNTVGDPKRLSRLAMRGIVPERTRRAMTKIVPTPLFERGLLDREQDTVRRLLSAPEAARRGFVIEHELRDLYGVVQRDGADPTLLWKALTLEMWLRSHWR